MLYTAVKTSQTDKLFVKIGYINELCSSTNGNVSQCVGPPTSPDKRQIYLSKLSPGCLFQFFQIVPSENHL